jgi:hypothetical protein
MRFKVTQLNQIIAIEKGVKGKAQRAVTDLYHEAQKTQLFGGISRTYRPKDDAGDMLPPESTLVQLKADVFLEKLGDDLTRLFDVTATKETANTTAKADVLIDGDVLLKGVPVTYLLFLEKQLTDVRTFISKLPTLDPAVQWHWDSAVGAWATDAVETHRSKKVPRVLVKAAATDKHPAQVDVWQEDVIDGYWSTIKFSGALPVDRVNQLLERVDKLSDAVKFAREAANSVPVTDVKIGDIVFGYLLAE